jgi:putative toxin-antitoxin system antitoxin component (TIGR02293 family)
MKVRYNTPADLLMPPEREAGTSFMVQEPFTVPVPEPFAVISRIKEGFSTEYLSGILVKLGLTYESLAPLLGTSPVSLSRWAKAGKRLDAQVSEAALKIQELADLANAVLGSLDAAEQWFKMPNFGLGNRRPLDLLDTETGRGIVRRQLLALEHSLGF